MGTGQNTDRLFTLGLNGGSLISSGSGPISFLSTGDIIIDGLGSRSLSIEGSNVGNNILSLRLTDDASGNAIGLTKVGPGFGVLDALNTYKGVTKVQRWNTCSRWGFQSCWFELRDSIKYFIPGNLHCAKRWDFGRWFFGWCWSARSHDNS